MQLTLISLFDRIKIATGNLYGTVEKRSDAKNNE